MQSLKRAANERLAQLADRVDESMARVDEKMERLAAKATPQKQPPSSPATPKPTPPSASTTVARASTEVASSQPSAAQMAAATKAFEHVPKDELVALLAKTNTRCKTLEMRYAELKAMHQTVLEEKRQIVLSKGRNGVNLESEREQIEGQLRPEERERLEREAFVKGEVGAQVHISCSRRVGCQ